MRSARVNRAHQGGELSPWHDARLYRDEVTRDLVSDADLREAFGFALRPDVPIERLRYAVALFVELGT